jgi:hypothetical protein
VVRLRAGWAVQSKRPRTHDDYKILSASEWPCGPADFDQIITGHATGDVMAGEQGMHGAGLPWVIFGAAKLHGEPWLCVIRRDWTDIHDASSRQVVSSKLLCVSQSDLDGLDVSLRDLYTAAQARFDEWDVPDELDGPPTTIDVVPSNPDKLAKSLAAFDLTRLATVAAAVADRNVSLLDGRALSLTERIDFLDGVAALLPAGARTWLRSATWSEKLTGHSAVCLAFSRRVAEGNTSISLTGPLSSPTNPVAARYRTSLLTLCEKYGLPEVIRHLAAHGAVTSREPSAVVAALRRMDLEAYIVDCAREKRLRLEDVVDFEASHGLRQLDAGQRREVLEELIRVAGTESLDLIRRHWSDDLYPAVRAMAATHAHDRASLAEVVDYATALNVGERLLTDLLDQDIAAVNEYVTAELRTGTPSAPVLSAARSGKDVATRLVLAQCTRNKEDDAVAIARTIGDTPLYLLVTAVLFGYPTVTGDNIGVFESRFSGATVTLLHMCMRRWDERVASLVPAVIEWIVDGTGHTIKPNEREIVARLLANAKIDPAQQPVTDLVCYGLGGRPRRSPWGVVENGGRPAENYVSALATFMETRAHNLMPGPRQLIDHGLTEMFTDSRRTWPTPDGANLGKELVRRIGHVWTDGRPDIRFDAVLSEIEHRWPPAYVPTPPPQPRTYSTTQSNRAARAVPRSRTMPIEERAEACASSLLSGFSAGQVLESMNEGFHTYEEIDRFITAVLAHVAAYYGDVALNRRLDEFIRLLVRDSMAFWQPEDINQALGHVYFFTDKRIIMLGELHPFPKDGKDRNQLLKVASDLGKIVKSLRPGRREPSAQDPRMGPQ